MSKRLMPTYLVNFLKEIYDGTIPSNFGKRMVSRQFIARVKELYETLGGDNPSDYSRRMVNEYLIKFFNEIEIVEYTDDDVLMTKTISSDLVYPACRIDAIGGMSYVVDGVLQDSPVTAVKTYNIGDELIDTYTVPSAITSLEGYGQGINSTVYNSVDFASGKYTKKVGVVDLGSLTWTTTTNRYVAQVPENMKGYDLTIVPNWLCEKYRPIKAEDSLSINTDGIAYYEGIRTYYAPDVPSPTGLLYFELATPVETTITENAPLLEVESGGKVVLDNEYNNDVPSEVTTWIKGN